MNARIVALGIAAALVAAGCGGTDDSTAMRRAADGVTATLRGLPQQGDELGRPDASLTVTLYADPSCSSPGCADLAGSLLPTLIERYVRTGRARLVLQAVGTPGFPPGNRRYVLAAGQQSQMWNLALLGWRVSEFETDGPAIARGLQTLDVARLQAAARSSDVEAAARSADAAARAQHVTEAPMLLVSAPRSGVVGRVALDGDGTALDRLERILGAAVQPVRQPPSTPEPATTARPSATAPASTSRPATTTKPATADRPVRVVLDATTRPSFVCVETADGARVFAGVLAGRRTFSGAHLRVSIGLKTTRLTVDGRAVPIDGSPAAFDVTHHGATRLPGAQAPCG